MMKMLTKISDDRVRRPIGKAAARLIADEPTQSLATSIPCSNHDEPQSRPPDKLAGSDAIRAHAGAMGLKVEASPNG
jgi:hypothetical protein